MTDSEGVIEYRENDESKAGINNLLTIMSAVTGKTVAQVALEYQGKGYGDFKSDVAEAVVEHIRPIRTRYDELSGDKAYLIEICKQGAQQAGRMAARTMKKVYKKVGFVIE